MVYDLNLEMYAKKHTDKCIFELSNVEDFGENIFKTNSSEGPLFTLLLGINIWWDQIKHVTSNKFIPYNKIFNFAQMAWAKTNKVGCSVNDCGTFKLALCYYNPRGNIDNNDIYQAGSYCEDDNDCVNVNNGKCLIGKGLCSVVNNNEEVNITANNVNINEVTINSEVESNDLQNSPENSISLGNIGGGLIDTVSNGINDAGSFIKNTSSNLVSQAENTANNLLNGATNLFNNVGQTIGNATNNLFNNTSTFFNSTNINLNSTFLGNIANIIKGALSLNSNGTQDTQQIIGQLNSTLVNNTDNTVQNLITILNGLQNNTQSDLSNLVQLFNNGTLNETDFIGNLTNMINITLPGFGNISKINLPTFNGTVNLFNTTSNIDNLFNNITNNSLNNLTTLAETLLNQTDKNSSEIVTQLNNVTESFLNTTQTTVNVTTITNNNESAIITTTSIENLLNETLNTSFILTTPSTENVTSISGSSSISPEINISTTTVINSNSSISNETTTLIPLEITTTCEWGIICTSNIQVTNQILENIITISPILNNSSSTIDTSGCKDLQENCDIMVLLCSLSMYQPFMFKTCPKTCKQC